MRDITLISRQLPRWRGANSACVELPGLLPKMDSGDEQHSKGGRVDEFRPSQLSHHQGIPFCDKPSRAANRDRQKSQGNKCRKKMVVAAHQQSADHHHFGDQKTIAMREFLRPSAEASSMNANLHIVNLVHGEEKVSNPQDKSGAIQLSGHNVIGRRCSHGESQRADELGEHPRGAAQFAQKILGEKCGDGSEP
jgi:hypothetical protein